jgi:putative DNA primase/helicase
MGINKMEENNRTNNPKIVNELVKAIRDIKSIYFNGKQFYSNNLAGDIIYDGFNPEDFSGVNRGFIVINSKDKDIYIYRDGVYQENGEDIIRCIARIIMGKKATNQRVTEVITAIKQMAALYIEVNQLNNYTNLINLQNGIYNTDTGELLEHDKKYLFSIKLDIIYDKNAKCERFLQFQSEIHNPEDIPLIQELFGYSLYPKYEFHKIFFCIGNGRNGKGTEQYVLKKLVGEKTVSSASIKQIAENPFMSAQLHNKLINVGGEISEAKIFDTAIIKALSGGDSVTGQHKNKQPFDFINYAKLIFACNKAPELQDDTTALWNRMIVIDYPNEFLDVNPKTDPKLREKMTTPEELSGVFIWAMEGLKRLKINGKFTYNKTPTATKKHYDTLRNHVILFAENEKLIYKPDIYIFKNKIYKEYKEWCLKQNPPIIPCNPLTFSKKLFEAVMGCTSDKIQVNGKRFNVYMDIAYEDNSRNEIFNYPEQEKEHNSQTKLEESNITLDDKINSLKVFLENNPKTYDELINEGFEPSLLDGCIDRNILIKRPDNKYEIGV